MIFERIGLAITFSPTGKALLANAVRLKNVFGASLMLIHVGEKNDETEKKLIGEITEAGLKQNDYSLFWGSGNPANVIIDLVEKNRIDLLIVGALEKEKGIKYYIGSVARKIMRRSVSSSLILPSPEIPSFSFRRFCVVTDYSKLSEEIIIKAYQFALLEKAEEFSILRELQIPGLLATVSDSGSASDAINYRNKWVEEESQKLSLYVRELNLSGIPVTTKCLYGKEGWQASKFARDNKYDVFVIPSPQVKLSLFDRIFTNRTEFVFERLPANLLIIKA